MKPQLISYWAVLVIAWIGPLAACSSHPTPSEVREKTANATAELKSNAKAVAEGVKEGWSRDKPLDLNHATKNDLLALPGVTEAEADRIIAERPYDRASDLVRRGIVSKRRYDQFADRLTTKK